MDCRYCGQNYSSKGGLSVHIKRVHEKSTIVWVSNNFYSVQTFVFQFFYVSLNYIYNFIFNYFILRVKQLC